MSGGVCLKDVASFEAAVYRHCHGSGEPGRHFLPSEEPLQTRVWRVSYVNISRESRARTVQNHVTPSIAPTSPYQHLRTHRLRTLTFFAPCPPPRCRLQVPAPFASQYSPSAIFRFAHFLLANATRACTPRYRIACASSLSLTMHETGSRSGPRLKDRVVAI